MQTKKEPAAQALKERKETKPGKRDVEQAFDFCHADIVTRFNTHGRKHFLIPLQESGEDEMRRRLSPSVPPMNDVTRILSAIEQGDPRAAAHLLPLVYDELRRLATQRMAQEAPGQTLQATALVHEVYLRLVEDAEKHPWNSRGHFFAAAAEAMRRILVENARHKQRLRHGGDRQRANLDNLNVMQEEKAEELLALDEALERLAGEDATVGEVVKLRYFAGLTIEQTAAALSISVRTANRHIPPRSS